MRKKVLAVLSLLIILTLTGCLEVSQKIWHNPDGSGRVVLEMILSEDMLSFMGAEGSPEENREEILRELEISPEDMPTDDPNIRNAAYNTYYDPEQRNFHVIMDIDLVDLVIGLPVEADADLSTFEFSITDNNDGTYRFSQIMDASSDIGGGDLDQASISMFETFMADDMYTLELHVPDLIEADPRAVHNRNNKVVVWEVPMLELMTLTEPIEFWAIYRIETSSFIPGLDLGGLPNWVPAVVLGLCCLSLVAVVIIVIVVVLVVRKRKKNQDQPEIIEPETTFN
jgi:hypothetical protein